MFKQTSEATEALQHRLAMYQQLSAAYPLEYKHLQKQVEIFILLERFDDAELLLLQLQNTLINRGLTNEAKKAADIRNHINKELLCNQLYSTPFLHLASSTFLEKAFRKHRRIELEEGDYLIRYGAHDTQMFILISGELAVWSRDEEGNKHFEHTMQVGEVVGELAFLDNTPRTADVIVCKKSTLLAIPSDAVLKLFMENPDIEEALQKSATARKVQMALKKNSAMMKLPKDVLSLLAKQGKFIHFNALERIYPCEQTIQTIDLITQGYVRLVGELGDGTSLILNSLKQGTLLGCSAAIPHMERKYTTDIVSMDKTTLIQFPLAFFQKIMATNPRLYQAVLQCAELEQNTLMQTVHTKQAML